MMLPRLILATALLASLPALAQMPPPTITLPTPFVNEIAGNLAKQPYASVSALMDELRACVAAQVPQNGVTMNRGGCPGLVLPKPPPAPTPKAAPKHSEPPSSAGTK
jgi:hypothetical protein